MSEGLFGYESKVPSLFYVHSCGNSLQWSLLCASYEYMHAAGKLIEMTCMCNTVQISIRQFKFV